MRPLVLGLLLFNLFYFGWAEWIDVPAPPAPSSIAGLPSLTLVRDLPPDKRAALAKKMSLETPPSVCVSVGPFDDAGVAAKAVALLQAKSFMPKQRSTQLPAVQRVWVYLDGFASDAGVTRALHRLEHGGIDDAEAMPPEAGSRRISLGLYSDLARAGARVTAVRALGLKPRLGQRTVPGTVYWLDLSLPNSSAPVPLKDVSDLEPGGGSSPISVQPCPTAAAPAAIPASPPVAAPTAKSAPAASPPLPAAILPRCKPGGGGPVPCVGSESRDSAHPSVL
ncbi:MAG: hypothetical protein ACRES6_08530 [Steroidobacteraceae bacterium]